MDKHLTKLSILAVIAVSSVTSTYSQKVTVKATTDKKEVAAILAKEREEGRANRVFR